MPTDPFARDGIWLRCALHAHTTESDGTLSPGALVEHYGQAGYDVVAITDHWVRTVAPASRGLVTLPGVELDATLSAGSSDAHVLALGVEIDPEPCSAAAGYPSVAETVAWTVLAGGVAFLAHAYWSGLASSAVAAMDGIAGVEIFNTGCEIAVGRGLSSVHWDDALDCGRPLLGIAADDTHHPPGDSCRAWVWARCAERSPEAVLDALRAGAFYSSTGPAIESLAVSAAAVEVRCSPAASVTLVQGPRSGARVNAPAPGFGCRGEVISADDDGQIRAVRLERLEGAAYGRVEVEDASGCRAWSNPLWTAGERADAEAAA